MPSFDCLVVGDAGVERTSERRPGQPILGGGAGRLAAHAAGLGAEVALVAKLGDDEAAGMARDWLSRLKVDLRWVGTATGSKTTVWQEVAGRPEARRVERGGDLALRLDELPSPAAARARVTVVSGYSLSVEPARAAALGALRTAPQRGGRAALYLEAELLWWTNARMARKVLEQAIALSNSVALAPADIRVLFGAKTSFRDALREVSRMGPRIVYLGDGHGGALLQEGARIYEWPGSRDQSAPVDRYAGPAAFWVGQSRGLPPRRAVEASLRHARTVRRPGAPRSARTT